MCIGEHQAGCPGESPRSLREMGDPWVVRRPTCPSLPRMFCFSTGSAVSWEPACPRKTTLTQVPSPEVLIQCVWGGAWESAFLSGFPGDSSVHQGLRITVDQPGNWSARGRQRGGRRRGEVRVACALVALCLPARLEHPSPSQKNKDPFLGEPDPTRSAHHSSCTCWDLLGGVGDSATQGRTPLPGDPSSFPSHCQCAQNPAQSREKW